MSARWGQVALLANAAAPACKFLEAKGRHERRDRCPPVKGNPASRSRLAKFPLGLPSRRRLCLLQRCAQALLLLIRERGLEDTRFEALQLRQNLVRCRLLDQHEQSRRALGDGPAEVLD